MVFLKDTNEWILSIKDTDKGQIKLFRKSNNIKKAKNFFRKQFSFSYGRENVFRDLKSNRFPIKNLGKKMSQIATTSSMVLDITKPIKT